MKQKEWMKSVALLVMFFFVFQVGGMNGATTGAAASASASANAEDEDPIALAKKAVEAGDYDKAVAILKDYLAKLKATAGSPASPATSEQQAEPLYLLAKVLFESGKIDACDDRLRELFRLASTYEIQESNLDFKARVERVKAGPGAQESVKAKGREVKKKKKTWLLAVAAGVVVAVAAVLLLGKKSDENGNENTTGTLTATMTVDSKSNFIRIGEDKVAIEVYNPYDSASFNIEGNAYYDSSHPFSDLFLCTLFNSGNFYTSIVSFPGYSLTHTFWGATLFFFFLEQGNADDNRGSAKVTFLDQGIKAELSARENCYSLEPSTAARIDLPAGNYRIKSVLEIGDYSRFPCMCYCEQGKEKLGLMSLESLISHSGGMFYAFYLTHINIPIVQNRMRMEFYRQ